MHEVRLFRKFLLILLVLIFSCGGSSQKADRGVETFPWQGVRKSDLEGSEIEVSTADGEQQNPRVIYLWDRRLYFVVWEDWRDGQADIYGRFLREDGAFCGNEINITNDPSNNQTWPAIAYDYRGNAGNRIFVAWQDNRGTAAGGYIYYRTISNLPTHQNCNITPTLNAEASVGYTQILGDSLVMRKKTSVAYNPSADEFLLVWVEGRNGIKRVQETCFGLANRTESFGDYTYLGYVRLSNANTPGVNGGPDIFRNPNPNYRGVWRVYRTQLDPSTEEYSYELFEEVDDPKVSCDTTANACQIVFQTKRTNAKLRCTCDIALAGNQDVCDDPSEVRALALNEYTKEQRYGIHGLVHYEINQLKPQTRISDTDGNAYRPDVAFDNVNKRFLVVWEEEKFITDQQGNTIQKLPKVYGRLITTSGYYTEPFVISFTDNNRDSQNDPEVENSRQTNPSVVYDDVNKRFFVIWQDSRNSPVSLDNMDIYGQYVNPEGSLSGSNYVINANPHNQLTPVVGYSNNLNQYIAIWKDARNARQARGSDIYAQRFTLGQPQLAIIDPATGLAIHPTVINFGSQSVNSITSKGLKFRNVGDAKLRITDITSINLPFRYENPPNVLVDNDPNTFIELDPGAEIDITISFRPTQVGSHTAEFTVNTNGGNRRVSLYGLGIAASIRVEEGDGNNNGVLDFSDVRVSQSSEKWFRLINDSSMRYNITSIVLPSGEPFSMVSPPDFPIDMIPGRRVDIFVRFSPTSRGNFGGPIRINTDDPSIGSVTLNISGRGIAPVLALVGSNRVDFGQVLVNTTSSRTVTVKNDGDAPMRITSCGSDPSGVFRASSCPSGNINPGDTVNITYEFLPTDIKSYTATMDIQSDGGAVQINFSGSGVAGRLEVQPSTVDFGGVEVGGNSERNITLRNTGNFTLTIQNININNNVFSLQGVNLPLQIPPGSSTVLRIRFSPTSQTSYSAIMTISSNGINSSVNVSLSGSGLAAGSGSGGGGGNQGGSQPILTSNQGGGGCSMGHGAEPVNALAYVMIGTLPVLRRLLRRVL